MRTLGLLFVAGLAVAAAGCEDPNRLSSAARNVEGGATITYGHYTPRTLGESGGAWVSYSFNLDRDGGALTPATTIGACEDLPSSAGPCVPAADAAWDDLRGRWPLPDGGELSVSSEPVVVTRTEARGATLWTLDVPSLSRLRQSARQPLFGDAIYLLGDDSDGSGGQLARVDVASGAVAWLYDLPETR